MRIHKYGALAVLWLAFAGMSFAAPVLTWTQTFNVYGGGEFMGSLDGAPAIPMFCVDFNNYAIQGAMVNIDTAANISDTRFGTTTDTTTFATFSNLGITALQRYVMAAWLTTQFNIPNGNMDPDNVGIQSAIWNLLNVTGSGVAPVVGNESTWINNAKNWLTNPADAIAVSTITSELRIYTDVRVAGLSIPQRYGPDTDGQEFIGLTPTPEPVTYLLLGSGMLLMAGIGRRKNKV
jgi:hypothetical protein